MDYLWSPWRYQYISGEAPRSSCVFCDIAKSGDDEANLVVHRADRNYIVLNRFPYSSGHLMIVPYSHVGTLAESEPEVSAEMMRLMRNAESILREVYRPDGLNMGLNIGQSAGAGIAQHLHMHVLPRWPGDANFMTTVAETRVLPEDLTVSWRKIKGACARW